MKPVSIMRVLPVLDLLDGVVVHGVAGRRDEYRPIRSQLIASSDVLEIAQAIRATFGLRQLYVADLDGILKRRPSLRLFQRLIDDGFDLLVDAGFSQHADIQAVQETGVKRFIVGLESCRSPRDLEAMIGTATELIFSLDLQQGVPKQHAESRGWGNEPLRIIQQVARIGVDSILVLDLADVGMGTGGSTDSLCGYIHDTFPEIPVLTGGGVRGVTDLRRFESIGVSGVLVASALHDGRLTRADVGG